MTVRIKGQTQIKSQTLVGFPPQPALNLNFTQGYANGLNPMPSTVTFTRADSAAVATQVGPDGYVRLAAHNQILYSQDFSNAAWQVFGTGAAKVGSAPVAAPDGTMTAYEVSLGTVGGAFGSSSAVYQSSVSVVSGSVYTFSVWVRAASGSTSVRVGLAGGATNNYGTNDVVVTTAWQRIQITATADATSSIANGSIRTNTAGTSANVYVWGAQFEKNLTPSYYVPTTSAAKYADTPRFDYDPVTLQPKGLLIEEARTNYFYPSVPTSATWNTTNSVTLVNNDAGTLAPDGSQTAMLVTATAANGFVQNNNPSAGGGQPKVSSVWIKRKTGTGAVYIDDAGAGAWYAVTVGSDWTRVSVYIASSGTNNYGGIKLANNGDAVWVWGYQVEAGSSFATSYIPTTSAPAPRAAESATMTGTNFSSWYAQGIGTFFLSADALSSASSDTLFVSTGSSFNPGSVGIYGPFNTGYTRASSAYTAQASAAGSMNANTVYRTAFGFKTDSVAICMNGGTVVAATPPNAMPTTPDTLRLMAAGVTGSGTNGHIAKLQYWPARFSDAQLQLITKG